MNYTYYKKLNNLDLSNKKILKNKLKKEISENNSKFKTSYWKGTAALKKYNNYLKIIKIANIFPFRKCIFKNIYKKLNRSFDNKIRVVFFCYEFQTFPTFKSVYDKIKNNDKFICELVHIPFYHLNKVYDEDIEIKDYIANGYKEIINSSNYDLYTSSPDIAFFLKPYDLIPKEYYIDEIKQVIEKSIYIPYGMEIGSTKESMRYQFQLPLHDEAWMCVSYCTEHYRRSCKYSMKKGKNYKLLGHPRMDLTKLDLTNDKEYKKIKKLAAGRKIFMWNPHFTIENGEDNWGTFLLYGLDILKYFSKNKNFFLLFRPHPFLKEALKKNLSSEDYELYIDLLNKNSDNIYLDESGNYLISMHISDILISDANSFVPEYLIYNKPVIYTKKPNTTGFKNNELENLLYVCNNIQDIYNFINSLGNDNLDYLLEERKEKIRKIFKYDENISVADKIINYILDEYK